MPNNIFIDNKENPITTVWIEHGSPIWLFCKKWLKMYIKVYINGNIV